VVRGRGGELGFGPGEAPRAGRLPVMGPALFPTRPALWVTSALWYFTNVRFGFWPPAARARRVRARHRACALVRGARAGAGRGRGLAAGGLRSAGPVVREIAGGRRLVAARVPGTGARERHGRGDRPVAPVPRCRPLP